MQSARLQYEGTYCYGPDRRAHLDLHARWRAGQDPLERSKFRLGEALKCPVELGYYGVVASQVGVQSLRQQKYMTWDRTKERIVKA